MASLDEVITELKRLTPEQVDEVARIIDRLSMRGSLAAPEQRSIPTSVVHDAVKNGWPERLFTELIGSLPDLERAVQPPIGNRADL